MEPYGTGREEGPCCMVLCGGGAGGGGGPEKEGAASLHDPLGACSMAPPICKSAGGRDPGLKL